jgi:hypothetical protein
MRNFTAGMSYFVVCVVAGVLNVQLANMLVALVLPHIPKISDRAAQQRPLSRVELHQLRAQTIAAVELLPAVVAPKAAAGSKVPIAMLVAALDRAETEHAPARAASKPHRTRTASLHAADPEQRLGTAQASMPVQPKSVRAVAKPAGKTKLAKATVRDKSRSGKVLQQAAAGLGMLAVAPVIVTAVPRAPQRLRLAETPGEMMFRSLLGHNS